MSRRSRLGPQKHWRTRLTEIEDAFQINRFYTSFDKRRLVTNGYYKDNVLPVRLRRQHTFLDGRPGRLNRRFHAIVGVFPSQKGEDPFYTIYEARFEAGAWRGPWVAPFSGEYFDADAFVTPDGERLLFLSMRPVEGSTPLQIPDIWYVDREDGGWGDPINAGSPVNRPESCEAYVTTTRDGTLYFSSVNRGDAKGGHDVYRFRDGDRWSGPRNLGPLVNTDGDERTPALSPDGRLLFLFRDGKIYYIAVAAVEALSGHAGE